MLGKLFKYNMRAVSKILILIHAVALIFSILISFFMPTLMEMSGKSNIALTVGGFLSFMGFGLYLLTLFAILFATYFVLAIRFYRNMFTDEAYLTHTLPVKPGSLLFSHILTGTLWLTISILAMVFGALIVAAGAMGFEGLSTFLGDMSEFYHTSLISIILIALQFLIVETLCSATMIYLTICIGSLFPAHKVIASIISYIAIYTVTEILNLIVMMLMPNITQLMFDQSEYAFPPASFLQILGYLEILALVLTAVYWIASHIIIKRHLNLE